MKKVYMSFLAVMLCLAMADLSYCANEKASPKELVKPTKLPRPGFGVIAGSIVKIDKAGPESVRVEVKSESDNTVHAVEVTNTTNVTKVTDASELKVGDAVRMMTRKIDDKEVAMSVVTGNIKQLTARKSAPPGAFPLTPAKNQAPRIPAGQKK